MAIRDENTNPHWQKIRKARLGHEAQKIEIRERHEIAMQNELAESDNVLVEAILSGYAAGLSQSAIGRAYGSKDYKTIRAFIDKANARKTVLDRLDSIDPGNGWTIVEKRRNPIEFVMSHENHKRNLLIYLHGVNERERSDWEGDKFPSETPEGLEWAFEELRQWQAAVLAENSAFTSGRAYSEADPEEGFDWGEG